MCCVENDCLLPGGLLFSSLSRGSAAHRPPAGDPGEPWLAAELSLTAGCAVRKGLRPVGGPPSVTLLRTTLSVVADSLLLTLTLTERMHALLQTVLAGFKCEHWR